jgi:hypothetical protein
MSFHPIFSLGWNELSAKQRYNVEVVERASDLSFAEIAAFASGPKKRKHKRSQQRYTGA